MTERPSHADRYLDSARAAVDRGDFRKGLRETWAAAVESVRMRDERALVAALDLARMLVQRTAGRRQREAEMLQTYVSSCLDDLRVGVEQQSIIDRIAGWGGRSVTKTCPECAERVQAVAKVCRFCGYRFEPPQTRSA